MSKLNIAVLVSGNGSNLQALIDAAEQGEINGQICIVISDRKEAFALQRAKNHGIQSAVICRDSCSSKADWADKLLAELTGLKIDLVVLAGFLSILPAAITKHYEGKIINIHPSLIPAFCGKGFYGERVHEAVIANGDKQSGATVHFVDEGTDTGPIILQQAVKVLEEDTPKILAARVLEIEHQLIVRAVALYCDQRLKLENNQVRIL